MPPTVIDSVRMRFDVSTHEVGNPLGRDAEIIKAVGGELGAELDRAKQAFGIGVVVARPRARVRGLDARLSACAALALFNYTAAQAEDAAVTAAAPAAEAVAPASPWSFNLTLASQYVTRGFSNSKGKPVLQGGVDYVHPGGFNAGFWMSTLSDEFVGNSWAETDYYVGYTKAIGSVNIGAQLYYYIYPNGEFEYDGTVKRQSYDYGEFVPTFNYKWFTAEYWYTYTKDYFGVNDVTMFTSGRGHSRGSGYLDLNVNHDLGNGLALQVHYGHQKVANFERTNWSDAKLGVSKSFDGGWTATVETTKAWSRTTDNIYGAGYTFDWSKYTVNPATGTFDPIKTAVVFSVTKVF